VLFKQGALERLDFADRGRLESASPLKAEIKTANAGEQG
jgi:hypothetical protein